MVAIMLSMAGCAPSLKAVMPASESKQTDSNGLNAGGSADQGSGPIDPGAGPGTPNTPRPPSNPASPGSRPAPFDSLADGPAKYQAPWKNPQTVIVIDAYQGNAIDWTKMATDPRVAGVIHRSSIGLSVDTKYSARKAEAKKRGYLWGAYHLGRAGDAVEQAKFFLKTVGNDPSDLWALDLEDTSNSSMMNIDGSIQFMEYVYKQTGRVPVVYANQSVTQTLSAKLAQSAVMKKARLWYARFRTDIPSMPKGLWPTYFLWQFSSEINCSSTGRCLYNVPGTSFDMDINVFWGSKEALASQWSN